MLPPGRARVSTTPAPTGSETCTNTIGTVRVTCCNAVTLRVPLARITSGASATNSACVFAIAFDIVLAPAGVDSHVAAVAPAQLLQGLLERRDASLTSWIICGHVHEYADAPHLLGLLRPRREGPRATQADSDNELASSHGLPRAESTAIQVATRTIKSGNCNRRNGVQLASCAAAIPRAVCLTWVNSGHGAIKLRCPLYPQ